MIQLSILLREAENPVVRGLNFEGEVKKMIQNPFKIWKRRILSAFTFLKETGLVNFNSQVVSSSLALYSHQVFCLVGLLSPAPQPAVADWKNQ